jgi:hypothetical protein
MATVKLKMHVPDSLADIPLEQYQKYVSIVETNKDIEEIGDFLNLKSLEVFCGIELKDSYNVPVKNFMFALERLEACFREETPLIRRFMVKDASGKEQEFGMIPKLDDMSFGEYSDLEKYICDWKTMHRAMAVLFRPIKTIYTRDIYELREYTGSEEYAEVMKEIPVNIVIGAWVFFYRLGMKLLENTMDSLVEKEQMSSKLKELLDKDGDGILPTMHYVRETLLELMKHRKFHSIRP